jgi:hypothetical protein
VVERYRARVYGRSLAGIAGSSSAGDMDVCLLCFFFFFALQVDVSARGRHLSGRVYRQCVTKCTCIPLQLPWNRQKKFDYKNKR